MISIAVFQYARRSRNDFDYGIGPRGARTCKRAEEFEIGARGIIV